MHHIRTPEWVKPAGHFCPNPPQQRKTQYVVGIG
ncbi:DUF1589 domain-containing protein, partial [Klebsiella pneumoniae]